MKTGFFVCCENGKMQVHGSQDIERQTRERSWSMKKKKEERRSRELHFCEKSRNVLLLI